MHCVGTTPAVVPGFNYHHQCKLERDHEGGCVCIGCDKEFEPSPPLPPRVLVESGRTSYSSTVAAPPRAEVRVVPAEEIDPARSLLAKDYMRWNPKKGS
jgi:hypothetical protein